MCTAHRNATFKKASYSSGGQNCLEVSAPDNAGNIVIRDSKARSRLLHFSTSTWRHFIAEICTGRD
ncbi:DUF397 domain-containing protein [Streptomyces orinoci]|uniref:DUF397 domain-containing protein n=1 Tax=Streptomyces orinoci TaxID=67339 RepID=A0ABV3K826_STRON